MSRSKQVNRLQAQIIEASQDNTQADIESYVVAAFHHFMDLPDYESLRTPLKEFCDAHQLKGTILLAKKGINSTIVGSREAINVDLYATPISYVALGKMTPQEALDEVGE